MTKRRSLPGSSCSLGKAAVEPCTGSCIESHDTTKRGVCGPCYQILSANPVAHALRLSPSCVCKVRPTVHRAAGATAAVRPRCLGEGKGDGLVGCETGTTGPPLFPTGSWNDVVLSERCPWPYLDGCHTYRAALLPKQDDVTA